VYVTRIGMISNPYQFLSDILKEGDHLVDISVDGKIIKAKFDFRETGCRVITQAVSRWLPTAAARVRALVKSCGICGGQSGTGADFLRVLRFPLPIVIPQTSPHSSSIIRGGTVRRSVVEVPSGLSLTPLQETKKKKKYCGLDSTGS
jgi:hypothetical protein